MEIINWQILVTKLQKSCGKIVETNFNFKGFFNTYAQAITGLSNSCMAYIYVCFIRILCESMGTC